MKDKSLGRGWLSRMFFWGCAAGLASALYVLSIGPAVWLYESLGGHPAQKHLENILEPFYAPLSWFVEEAPLLGKPLLWYVDLWSEE